MARNEIPCEAPYHIEGCNGVGNTRDHFTPKGIAKLLYWSHQQVNSPENIQRLSEACHSEKDRSTRRRIEQVRQQLHGRRINLGEHEV